jgi:hypothetical protein
MSRIAPRHALAFFVAATLVALAAIGITAGDYAKPQPTKLAVRDAADGLATGRRSHKPL